MDPMEVGKRIVLLRKKKALTQEMLAEALGIHSKTISRWETGRNMPDYGVLEQLAEALDTDVPFLLGTPVAPKAEGVFVTFGRKLQGCITYPLSKETKWRFFLLNLVYFLLRDPPFHLLGFTSQDRLVLNYTVFTVFLLLPLYGCIGYFLLRKKAFLVPVAVFFARLLDMLIMGLLWPQFHGLGFLWIFQWAAYDLQIVAFSVIGTYLVYHFFRWSKKKCKLRFSAKL